MNVSDEAINAARAAVNLRRQPALLNRLGSLLTQRSAAIQAEPELLDEPISILQEALDSSQQDNDRSMILHNLGNAHGIRHQKTGSKSDLNQAIKCAYNAIEISPRPSVGGAAVLYNIANALGDRYNFQGALADLEESISITKHAISVVGPDNKSHPHLVSMYKQLAMSLNIKYSRTEDPVDNGECIQAIHEGLELATEDHHERASLLENLTMALGSKYEFSGTLEDLEEAIVAGRLAVEKRAAENQVGAFSNLASNLARRYQKLGDIFDLEEAVVLSRRAVNLVSEDAMMRSQLLHNLGVHLARLYSSGTRSLVELYEARYSFVSSLYQSNGPPRTRVKSATKLLQLTLSYGESFEIADHAVQLLQGMLRPSLTSLTSADRQYLISNLAGLSSIAAELALRTGKRGLQALKILENGRGLLTSSIQNMRIEISQLQEEHPELAKQLLRLRQESDMPATLEGPYAGERRINSMTFAGNRHDEISGELDGLLAEIRRQDGFKDFLLAPSSAEIKLATINGPIVVINVGQHSCDAILVEHSRCRAMNLPDLNVEDIKEKASGGRLGSLDVLEWLWDAIANPILTALGFVLPCGPNDPDFAHIWWIPTGTLTKFPLHAAGYHTDGSCNTVLDRVMSSYSSSIQAIIHGRRQSLAPFDLFERVFIVGMKETPEHSDLPFVTDEIRAVGALFDQNHWMSHHLKPCKEGVMSMLGMAPSRIFHFAGHGQTNSQDPLKSSLILNDWQHDPLTVADLVDVDMQQSARDIHQGGPFLAYLSACGTGQIKHDKLADESIHLASACQLAGFRHVIGTLWDVNDKACVDVALKTYEWMFEGGISDRAVCLGLHNALLHLRAVWLNEFKAREERSTQRAHTDGALVDAFAALGTHGQECTERVEVAPPRDVILCDDSDADEGENRYRTSAPLNWVPYVHYGV